jgi:hypothetical protein
LLDPFGPGSGSACGSSSGSGSGSGSGSAARDSASSWSAVALAATSGAEPVKAAAATSICGEEAAGEEAAGDAEALDADEDFALLRLRSHQTIATISTMTMTQINQSMGGALLSFRVAQLS